MIPDLINEIMKYLDDKTYINCLFASKKFHTYKINDIYHEQYLYRKYRNKYIYNLAYEGDLIGVDYLYKKNNKDAYYAICSAIRLNRFDIIKYLYEHDDNIKKKLHHFLNISKSKPKIYNFFYDKSQQV